MTLRPKRGAAATAPRTPTTPSQESSPRQHDNRNAGVPWVRLAAVGYMAAVLLVALIRAHVGDAHTLQQRCTARMPLRQLERCQVRALHHYVTAQKYLHRIRRQAGLTPQLRRDLRWHQAAEKWTRRELAETRKRLNPWAGLRERIPGFYWHAFVNLIHPCELDTWHGVDGIYYGGLQMDMDFQRTYGARWLARYGTADRWPMVVQVYVAYLAAGPGGRGFYPWPTCAARAGLI